MADDPHLLEDSTDRLQALEAALSRRRGTAAAEAEPVPGPSVPSRSVEAVPADESAAPRHQGGGAGLGSLLWRLSPDHLKVVAVLVVVALLAAGWAWERGHARGGSILAVRAEAPQDPAVATVAPTGSAAAPPAGAATASPAGSATVVIDVAGRVRRPGVFTLPAGSRVIDALRRAGGARRGVDLSVLNLARVLRDGEQVLVGAIAHGEASAGGSGPPLVDLNAATQTELESLPGVGPVTAGRIVEWRTRNGAFTDVRELLEVAGIGEKTLADLLPYVTV